MFHCDLCGSTPGLGNIRRRSGDVMCKGCLEEWDCTFGDMEQEGERSLLNPDGYHHPSENPEFEEAEA